MQRILLVKTSSMGDIIHCLPAVTDLRNQYPDAEIDWIVDESFAAIPALHPGVSNVLPVAIRRWRKSFFCKPTWREMRTFRTRLREKHYNYVLDLQGLLKSAFIASQARGPRYGHDKVGARERLAPFFYQHTYTIPWSYHAVQRNRLLAAQALEYDLPENLDYGISVKPGQFPWLPTEQYAALLHGSSGQDKLWATSNWIELGAMLAKKGLTVVLPWGTADEHDRSVSLASQIPDAVITPALNLPTITELIAGAAIVIGVDTGLAHLSVATGRPTIGIYCATDPKETGLFGDNNVVNLGEIGFPPDPATVIESVEKLIAI